MRRALFALLLLPIGSLATGCAPAVSVDEPGVESKAAPTPAVSDADASAYELAEGFTPLTLADFEAFRSEPQTWSGSGNILRCSGSPKGYVYTRRPYGNFTLRVDYRFERTEGLEEDAGFQGNTGFMIFITGDHKQWPVSLEVQGKYAEMAAIKANGGAESPVVSDSEDARRSSRRPVGEWNSIEIVARDGALQASINGTVVCTSESTALTDGHFGLQSEGDPVEFRNLQIRED